MKQLKDMYRYILHDSDSVPTPNRTGIDTFTAIGYMMKFDLRRGFPVTTAKLLQWKSVVAELLWIMRGETNVKPLNAQGVHIWDAWADKNGELGPVYGKQWRAYTTPKGDVDQLLHAIHLVETDPYNRRNIVTAWNVGDLAAMKLEPCHVLFQFHCLPVPKVPHTDYLDCTVYQRSCDSFLGVPFNIASYALLLKIVGRLTGKTARNLVWMGGNVHIYENHVAPVLEYLKAPTYPLPTLILDPLLVDILEDPELPLNSRLEGFLKLAKPEHCRLDHYIHGGVISAPIAV